MQLVLNSTEDTISGIAKTRADISVVIQATIQISDKDRNIRINLFKGFNSFRSSDDADEVEIFTLCTMLDQPLDSINSRSTSSEPRIKNIDFTFF